MFFTKKQVFFLVVFICVILPLGIISGVSMIENHNMNLFVYVSISAVAFMFLCFLYQCNSWEFTFEKLRVIYLVLFTFTVAVKLYIGGFRISLLGYDWLFLVISLLALLFMCCKMCQIRKASKVPEERLELAFPFQKGKYLITEGGDGYISSLMNYHYKSSTHGQHKTQKSMRYAVDIVKIGSWSRTTPKLIACANNADYAIFHDTIISPVDGVVVKVEDGIENNVTFPGKGLLEYTVGNHVVIKKEDYYIIMGHMEKNSILVKEGDYVKVGDKIGLVGNSGLTARPHLHMQVSKCKDGEYWYADGVAVRFNQTFYPVKNRMIKV